MGYFSPVIRSYLAEYAVKATGRLLDVGCGTAPHKSLFNGVAQYVGLDRPSHVYDDYAQSNERNAAINVVGSAYDLPFGSQYFDLILGLQIIEHLSDPLSFLQEAQRVLCHGGTIILTFPLINPVHEAPYDFFRFTEYGLRHLCEISNLQVKKVTPMGGGWLTVGYLLRSLLLWNEHVVPPPWWKRRFASSSRFGHIAQQA